MTLNEMINTLHAGNFNETELLILNKAVCDELKARRNRAANLKRFTLKAGDKVSWSGKRGYYEGTIVRVKRKKAIIDTGPGLNWDVPLNMLTAV